MRKGLVVWRCAPMGVLLLLGGCNLFGHANPDAPLIADSRSPIVDVPVPAGFSMADDSTSKVVGASGLRFVDHRYTGSDDLLPIVKFYEAQLPEKGWTFVDRTQPSNKEISLHFTKKSEDCYITVTRRTLTFDAMIRIKIDPAARNAGG